MTIKTMLAGAMALGLSTAAFAETQGVTDDEIVIGSATDLSGIFAAIGVPAANGATLRIEEQNAAGGIHGRQVRFIVEDHGYQLPRASQALNKLVHRDKIFASFQTMGTPHNLAGFQIMDPKGIFSISPLSASYQMLNEPTDNKFIALASYRDQARAGVEYLASENESQNICAMYLPTDFGIEISDSTKATAESLGVTFGAETTHKPDEQDFVGALQKLKAAECDLVTIALGVRQTITVVGTAKKLGWTDVDFLVTSAGFLDAVAAVPDGITDGLYAASSFISLAARASDPAPAAFMAAYEARYGEPANGFAMIGYTSADLLMRALDSAGPDLNQETFRNAMETLTFYDEILDSQIQFTPELHQGVNEVVISVVKDGLWNFISRQ